MTAEEYVKKRLDRFEDGDISFQSKCKLNRFNGYDLMDAYDEGAKEAISNQWISVDDDLPCNHIDMMDACYYKCTIPVIVKNEKGNVGKSYMSLLSDGKTWIWVKDTYIPIISWMPFPK